MYVSHDILLLHISTHTSLWETGRSLHNHTAIALLDKINSFQYHLRFNYTQILQYPSPTEHLL